MAEQALTDLNSTLHDLAVILIAIAVAGVAIAGLLGLFVARAAAAPVHLLRQAAEHVRSTGDLSRRIKRDRARTTSAGSGQSFNDMLGALEDSQRAQRQLVADASHELRTPVATIRTNLEVLARNPDLRAEERAPLLRDLIGESAELGGLVEDLLESARESSDDEPFDAVAARRRGRPPSSSVGAGDIPALMIVPHLQPTVILAQGVPSAARARQPPRQRDQVEPARRNDRGDAQRAGSSRVRDHGPGFAPADLPHVFDRFYRAASARTVPGSGLGLSIVRKVAEEHGGVAQAAERERRAEPSSRITFPLLDFGRSRGAGRQAHARHVGAVELG